MKAQEIILEPIMTEKSYAGIPNKIYTFKVATAANKVEIKKAVEQIFNVNVKEVRTVNVHRKAKRLQRYEGFKPAYKKAIVKLAPGQTISVFEV